MSLGHGMIHCFSNKQKSDEKSRTESELVATSDYLIFPIWLAMFMKEQGYTIKKSVLFIGNESAIKMVNRGKDSSIKHWSLISNTIL